MEDSGPKTKEDTVEDIPEGVLSVSRIATSSNCFVRGCLIPRSLYIHSHSEFIGTIAHAQGTAQEIKMQARMIDNEIKMMRQEALRLGHEREQMSEKIADNTTKIKQNKVLPYLVSKVVEVSYRSRQFGTWLTVDSRRRPRDPRGSYA